MSNENPNLKNMDDILTEKEVLDLLGIKRSTLDKFRYKEELPFCKISHTNRIYLVQDVLDFVVKKRMTINKGTG